MKKEEKQQRFKRLAATRTNEIINKLRVLSNCSNRSAYEYSEDDIIKIFTAIDKAVRAARSKFNFPHNKHRFKL